MAGETKAQLINNGKALLVTCDSAAFANIMQAVRDSVGYTEPVTEVVDLRVTDNSRWQQSSPVSKLRDRAILVGCAVITFVFLFVFVAGITKVIETLLAK